MSSEKKRTLAVALIVKDEAAHLNDCLETVKDLADEIVILDSGSTDATLEIARNYTDKVYSSNHWPGYGPQRRIAQTYVTADYLFWLDADERVSPELAQSIRSVLVSPEDRTVYTISRLTWLFGRYIRHGGWYPDRVIRMYPTDLTRFDDALVHEKVEVDNTIAVKPLKGDAIHYTYDDLHQYLVKSARYAKAWAEQRHRQGKTTSITQGLLHGTAHFIQMYILRAGFLDGKQGFLLAVLSAYASFSKYADLWTRPRIARSTD
ncbi:MAG: glycosyltransferase family 2 protein [Desulfobacteraceae bacterium]|nr:MAG: glycosyltransferase family 2 protein [Desulfobacteraceae bacterium]